MSVLVGNLFLNIAFCLYLILYFPQIYHNYRHTAFENMSFLMHLMILQAYSCDLCYALLRNMPWQYLCVCMIGLFCLAIQHLQWFKYLKSRNRYYFLLLGCLIIIWPLVSYCMFSNYKFYAGISRVLFLVHFIPQIYRYHQNKLPRDAVNQTYLAFSIIISICDLISAVCLNWDFANQLGTILSLGLKAYLYFQGMFPKQLLQSQLL